MVPVKTNRCQGSNQTSNHWTDSRSHKTFGGLIMKKIRPYHFEQCDDQPEDKPCICELLQEQLEEDTTATYLDDYISER